VVERHLGLPRHGPGAVERDLAQDVAVFFPEIDTVLLVCHVHPERVDLLARLPDGDRRNVRHRRVRIAERDAARQHRAQQTRGSPKEAGEARQA
jgi:hypothetical protein